jgi:hypothetical protein
MKLRLTDFASIVGISLILGPWLFDLRAGGLVYFGYLVGTVLLAIAGYDAQAHMLGQGNPGEKLLQSGLNWLKSKFSKS